MSFSLIKIPLLLVLMVSCTATKKNTRQELFGEKANTQTLANLHSHIQFLADDKLEGRRTGTEGERLAMEYIIDQFKTIGITPKGTEYYSQSFPVNDGKAIGNATEFVLNGNKLEAGKDFFPFPYSPDQSIEALPAIALRETDMPWFYDLKEILEENKDNPHFDLAGELLSYTKKAKDRGASAIIVYNTSAIDDKLAFEPKDRTEKLSIPVIFVSKEKAKKYFTDKGATLNLRLRTDIIEKTRIGHNVIGYIDNQAATTVVLGAHFDHLGYGEDGNSMLRTGEKLIHNGADDNASGTAAMIELARLLKASSKDPGSHVRNNNYLFIAFSGEELGLFGSKYFTENPTIDLKNVDYMINMDMVGRLNDSTRVVTIGGYGTSPAWGELFLKNQDPAKNRTGLVFKYDSSGTGPSDHTSFYRKDIPVLFYFTGLHGDYHKPTDDPGKINYKGELMIIQQIYDLVLSLNDRNKLAFTKTRETQTPTGARLGVTMGIMPDYTFAGAGVRADGISEGKPAQKAGLKTGDVIIGLGDNSINSMENYMQALSKFKKGDKTRVKFKRGNEILEATVEF